MAFWIVWLLIGLTFVVLFTGLVIPRVMLKVHAAMLPVRDKAIGRLSDEHGLIFVYAPSATARRYIKSYRIAHNGEGLYFEGEWAHMFAFVEYELTVYNAENDIIEVLRVKEKFNSGSTTHVTKLPAKADYVTLCVVCADDEPVVPERRRFTGRYAFWLAVQSVCFAVVVDVLVWLVTMFAIRSRDGFEMTLKLPGEVWFGLLSLTAIAVMAATAAVSLISFFLLRRRGEAYES